jgi:hypothetical protein
MARCAVAITVRLHKQLLSKYIKQEKREAV